jgi:hypothetical protein
VKPTRQAPNCNSWGTSPTASKKAIEKPLDQAALDRIITESRTFAQGTFSSIISSAREMADEILLARDRTHSSESEVTAVSKT